MIINIEAKLQAQAKHGRLMSVNMGNAGK